MLAMAVAVVAADCAPSPVGSCNNSLIIFIIFFKDKKRSVRNVSAAALRRQQHAGDV